MGDGQSWLAALGAYVLAGARSLGNSVAAASKFSLLGLQRLGLLLATPAPSFRNAGKLLQRALKYVWRRLVLLLLGGLVIAPLLASLFVAYGGANDLGVSPVRLVQALWLSLSIAAVGLLWTIAWLALKLIARVVRARSFGDNLGLRALSFLVIWAFFPKLPKAAVLAASWCAFQIAVAVPGSLLQLADPPASDQSQIVDRPSADAAPAPTGGGEVRVIDPARNKVGIDHLAPVKSPSTDQESTRLVLDVGGLFLTAVAAELRRVWVGVYKRVPLHDLTIAFVAWMALAFVLYRAFDPILQMDPQARSSRIWGAIAHGARATSSFLSHRWPVMGQNLFFLLILALGAFLSLAAIISLPRLRESNKPNSEVSVDALRAELQQLHLTQEQLTVYIPDDLLNIGVHAVAIPGDGGIPASNTTTASTGVHVTATVNSTSEDRAKEIQSLLSVARKQYEDIETEVTHLHYSANFQSSTNERLAELTEFTRKTERLRARSYEARLNFAEAQSLMSLSLSFKDDSQRADTLISNLVSSGSQLRSILLQDEGHAIADAISTYRQDNIDRQGSREQAQHFQLVRDWYAQREADQREAARQCGGEISRFRNMVVEWKASVRALLNRSPDQSIPPEFRTPTLIPLLPRPIERACIVQYSDNQRPPHSPDLGESLGAFKPVAAWLLNADSLALALVAGLLGFGLLGSVISTFVKAQIEQQKSGTAERPVALVTDLTGVVLRGISAAVVLFLAVQGGLAVLSGPGATPNPYVLLLACFVAAVFSERIWLKALDYLTGSLGKMNNIESSSAPASDPAPKPSDTREQEREREK